MSFLGFTQGGADFKRLQTFTTSLSGIELTYQFPVSLYGDSYLEEHIPVVNLKDGTGKDSMSFFEGYRFATNTWWYWGSWFKQGFDPIGHMRVVWEVFPMDKSYAITNLKSDNIIEYLKAFIYGVYENEGGDNDRIRKSCYDFYVRNGGYPVEHYAEDIQRMIKKKSIKHPDDYQVVSIHGNEWVRFSTYERRNEVFHVLPLNRDFLLVNMARFYYDCRDVKDSWEHEGIKIIDTVMNSTRVDFPDD